MAWYYGTFSCGHEGRVNIIGPVKNRQWIADRKFEGLCGECHEKHLVEEREKQNAEACKVTKEMELPELSGSEKQIAWANTLRIKFIEDVEKIKKEQFEDEKEYGISSAELEKVDFDDIPTVIDYILKNQLSAKFYIDSRVKDPLYVIAKHVKEAIKTENEKQDEIREKEIMDEAIVYPANKITDAVVDIILTEDNISVIFEKNNDFRKIVKAHDYIWESGKWSRKITERTGKAADRAAELGNELLNNGFPIRILDQAIRENAITGKYELECTKWIMKVRDEDIFVICWKGMNKRLYEKAKSLPGSYWKSDGMHIKGWHYLEVEDFANLYDFKFTKAAKELTEKEKQKVAIATFVDPIKVELPKEVDRLKEILNSKRDIIDDLKD